MKIFKSITIVIFSIVFSSLSAQEIQWKKLSQAMDENLEKQKLVFIDFYTDWCGWCKRMDQTTFKDKEVIDVMSKYFLNVKFNAEGSDTIVYNDIIYVNPQSNLKRFTHQFTFGVLGERLGYPSFAFMDKNNQLIGVISGYYPAEKLLVVFDYFTSEAYLSESFDDFSQKRENK